MSSGAQGPRSSVNRSGLLADLRSEGAELEGLVGELSDDEWRRETPAPGWTIAHQISHLAWTDDQALLAVRDPGGFAAEIEKALADADHFVDDGAERGARAAPAELLGRWRAGREALAAALADVPEGVKLPWFGPPMSVASMVTARLMETWAHGQDVADALGVARRPTARLRHIAWIGVRTRDFAYVNRGLQAPSEPFRVELTAPDGETWEWGSKDAPEQVIGPALDFCLVVTQRRHRADTSLKAVGSEASRWLDIAQAFAGPAGPGREAGQFS